MIRTFKTPLREIPCNILFDFVGLNSIYFDKTKFDSMCESGCPNYGRRWSCPPFSKGFNDYSKDHNEMFVIVFKINLDDIKDTRDYQKLKIANVVMKSRIEKVTRILEDNVGGKMLATGSCRLCKPCKKTLNEPCKHPDKMRPSLESTGVNVNRLCKELFDIDLLYYKKNNAPEYTVCVCGLLVNDSINKDVLIEEFKKQVNLLE